jgi:TonB family protein
MFTNRAFNIAFLISLTWHLLCISTVNIIILPGRYRARELSSVSFLGPILGKTALEIILVNKPVAVTTRYQHNLRYTHSFERDKPLMRYEIDDAARNRVNTHTEEEMSKIGEGVLRKDKEIPNLPKKASEHAVHLENSEEFLGPLAEREVIYRPKKPTIPSWITASAPYVLELEFSVSPQGEIKEIIPVVSSGSTEVDLLGIRYLKRWKFAPLTQGLQQDQRGRIKLTFNDHAPQRMRGN